MPLEDTSQVPAAAPSPAVPNALRRLVVRNNQIQELGGDDDEPEFELADPASFFSSHVNLIPIQNAVQGPRLFYGARFFNQTMPLKQPEAPLVQTATFDDPEISFDRKLGDLAGNVRSRVRGLVKAVEKDHILLQNEDGEENRIPLYNAFPFNRKSSIHHYPLVKPGDRVEEGQLLSRSNFTTEDGTLAMGANARVGLVPYLGYSMDDAIVISESMARKLTSEHMDSYSLRYDDTLKTGRDHFASLFPTKFKKEQLEKLDDDGVVQVGQVLQPGDPIILATKPKVVSSATAKLGQLSRVARQVRNDASQVWEYEDPAEVVDVAKTRKGVKVNVRSYRPTIVGDKVMFRSGAKGIVSKILNDDQMPRTSDGKPLEVLQNPLGLPCYDSETELLTTAGWIPFSEITEDHVVATLNPKTFEIEFQRPDSVQHLDYTGKMYKLTSQQLDILVTPNHRQFSAKRGPRFLRGTLDLDHPRLASVFELNEAREIFGQSRRYLKAAKWKGKSLSHYTVDAGSLGRTSHPKSGFLVTAEDWAEFMGWFLSEGSTYVNRGKKGDSYVIEISQYLSVNSEKYNQIKNLLQRLGLPFYAGKRGFRLSHKGLFERLAPLGGARDKFIPREILDMEPHHLQIFLDAFIKGDGCVVNNSAKGFVNVRSITTSSKNLADGLQEVLAKLGISSNVRRENRRGDMACYMLSLKKKSPATWVNWSERDVRFQTEDWVDYSGKVHCVTVRNGVLFVRRNGKAVFSGNSRANPSLLYEILLGKIAEKTGKPFILPGFNAENEKWYEKIENLLKEHGVNETEEVYDPQFDRMLESPITVGNAHMLKLHHVATSKLSARGQGSYDQDQLPAKGGGEAAQAKRLSGLESAGLMSAGAYGVLREGATIRGTRNDQYWRDIRQNITPRTPGEPFAWKKFQTLLQGAGMQPRELGDGKLRISVMTDRDLMDRDPVEVNSGDTVDVATLQPVKGGLFDEVLANLNKWGYINLPHPMPNPAAEETIRKLLGLTEKQFRNILEGKEELPDNLIR